MHPRSIASDVRLSLAIAFVAALALMLFFAEPEPAQMAAEAIAAATVGC